MVKSVSNRVFGHGLPAEIGVRRGTSCPSAAGRDAGGQPWRSHQDPFRPERRANLLDKSKRLRSIQ